MPNYQIRKISNPTYFSLGTIYCLSSIDKKYKVQWKNKGKVWKSEKAVKAHLLKYFTLVGPVDDLEIVELVLIPTKPAADWVDAKMLMQVLKNK